MTQRFVNLCRIHSLNIEGVDLGKVKRLGRPLVLDSYSLFDRKAEGDWRIVGHEPNFTPRDVGDVFFTYGDGSGRRKVDVFDNETPVTAEEACKLPPYAPFGDGDVKRELYPQCA